MNATEVRIALDRLKQLTNEKEFGKLSHDEKARLCQMIHAGCDEVGIALAVQAIDHPLAATIKKKRGKFFQRKFYLDGVLTNSLANRFETSEQAQQFATERGITLI